MKLQTRTSHLYAAVPQKRTQGQFPEQFWWVYLANNTIWVYFQIKMQNDWHVKQCLNRYLVEQRIMEAFHSMEHISKLMRWTYSILHLLTKIKISNALMDKAMISYNTYIYIYICFTFLAGICWPWIKWTSHWCS